MSHSAPRLMLALIGRSPLQVITRPITSKHLIRLVDKTIVAIQSIRLLKDRSFNP
ncbi:MAG: hypothetical protein WBA57_23055 [Elainellaceae cyanobacterium]